MVIRKSYLAYKRVSYKCYTHIKKDWLQHPKFLAIFYICFHVATETNLVHHIISTHFFNCRSQVRAGCVQLWRFTVNFWRSTKDIHCPFRFNLMFKLLVGYGYSGAFLQSALQLDKKTNNYSFSLSLQCSIINHLNL